ncbi:Por secretion system C-terminal sorting domain-containing protein [Ekhidna lutea]|uniref:Por secretion system C-terminal sorting domain-containing protein n=1 Tax=Ekhidna lutea TaxID=447679 RepID=A0A239J8G4_EKHLU|nr:PKD domain-containing protein [Ekhidna lutea]SNT02120.1 Por secretion system C-terminal sorting domain-containing protein [Ekhidna lutea]
MRLLIYFFLFIAINQLHAQNLSVSAPDTLCSQEIVNFENLSSGIDSVQWDFCPGDLAFTPSNSSTYDIPASTTSLDEIEVVFDGSNYYAFVLGLNNTLGRITIGDSLTDNPSAFTNFGTVGSISSPRRLSLIKQGGNWYIFISNLTSNTVSRIDFGDDLGANISASTNLGNLESELTQPFAIEALEVNGNYYLLVGNHSAKTVKIFNYGASYSNAPTLINTIVAPSGLGNMTSIKTLALDDELHIVISGQSNGYVYALSSNLSNSATQIHDLGSLGALTNPRDLDVLYDNGEIQVNVMSISGNHYSYRFDEQWNFLAYTDYGQVTEISDTRSIDFNKQNSQWTGFSINRSTNKELVVIQYPNECGSTKNSSTLDDPMDVAYDSLSWNFYTVHGFSDGYRYHYKDSIFIKGLSSVYFDVDLACTNSASVFSSSLEILETTAVSFSWNFDDPSSGASNTSSDANPTHVYSSPGDYDVILSVSDDCGITMDTTIVLTVFDENDLKPGFDQTTSLLCSNSNIQFNDTSNFISDEPQLWEWYIDDSLASTEQHPIFNFSGSGFYSVRLDVEGLSGCIKSAEEIIEIQEGPGVTISYDNNCFGSEVNFYSTVAGDDSGGYSWDLDGDLVEDSTIPNPSFEYLVSGDYTITLIVSNGIGCQTEVTLDLEVPGIDFIDFNLNTGTENLPVDLNALDETIVNDSVTNWSWVLNDTIFSNDQNTVLTVSEPGEYSVLLIGQSAQGCTDSLTKTLTIDEAISPSPSFTFKKDVCLDQSIELLNTSVNASSFEWDFCLEDFTETPTVDTTTFNGLSALYGYKLFQENGNWIGLLTERDANAIYRLEFGNSPLNQPDITNLGNLSGLLDGPVGFDCVYDNGNWHCFLGYFDNNHEIIRLDFGSSLTNDPTAIGIGSFGISGRIRDLAIVQHSDSSYLVLPSYSFNSLTIVNLGISVTDEVASEDIITTNPISGSQNINGVSVLKHNSSWLVFVSSLSNSVVQKLDFGETIFNSTPTIAGTYSFSTVNRPFRLSFIKSGANYFGVLGNDGLPFSIIDFSDFSSVPVELTNMSFPSLYGIDVIKYDGEFIVQGGFNNSMISTTFSKSCTDSQMSNEINPIVTYTSSGDHVIELVATNDLGNSDFYLDTIQVSINSAPIANFSINESRCVSTANIFTSSTAGLTYSWDFNNDEIEDSNEENPQVLFDTLGGPGTYTVRIDVNDGACDNFYEEDITIYPEPPTPTFDTSFPSLCENVAFSFTNTIDSSAYDSLLAYRWFLNGSEIATDYHLEYSFDSPGEKIIGLQAHIPGCESEVVQDTFNIITTPTADFVADTICISETLFFSNNSLDASSYSWDFDDGETSTAFEPSKIYADTGTYQVSLEAFDSSGNCSDVLIKEVRVNRNPPTPSYDVASVPLCVDSQITLSNSTDDDSFNSEVSYVWTVTDLGTFTDKDINLNFSTPGEKIIELQSIYRSCESAVISQTITINDLPTADFTSNSICEDESMQFTNTSESANSYLWDFGDGFTSTAENPGHIFPGAGNYSVTLTSTDNNGCDNTIVKEVSVSASPQPSFDFEVPCTSEEGTQFFDMSTVAGADIVSWVWEVDGVDESTEQNPVISFESSGTKTIGLTVTSSNGCETYYTEDIEILDSPQPDFTVSVGCQGAETTFFDNTNSAGSSTVSWLWTVNGVNYTTEDVTHTFDDSGVFEVSLEVTSQNFCSESITKTVEILELPSVDFSIQGQCDNQLIQVDDQSIEGNDPIISRTWMLNGERVGNGSQLFLNELIDGAYELALEVETSSGCVIQSSETLEVNPSPTAAFSSSSTYGLPSDNITFINSSSGAVSYEWLLNSEAISTNPDREIIAFSEAGTHLVSLVAENSVGCRDTMNQEILIAIPEVDLVIENLDLVKEDGLGKIFMNVQNQSNLPIEVVDVAIVLENQFRVTEQIAQFIGVGETSLLGLNIGIPVEVSEPAYFCVAVSSQYTEFEDMNPIDNERCLTIKPDIKVENPFPNPVTDRFRLKVIVPEAGTAKLSLVNSAGKVEQEQSFDSAQGLNNFFFDMSTLNPGIYFVMVEVAGETHKRKVIKL